MNDRESRMMERSMKKKNGRKKAQKAQERSRFGIGIVPFPPLRGHFIWKMGGVVERQNDSKQAPVWAEMQGHIGAVMSNPGLPAVAAAAKAGQTESNSIKVNQSDSVGQAGGQNRM